MANKKLKAPVNIPVEKIHPFEGHPYKVIDNDEMNNLIESIQQKGVISPIVVRPLEDTTDEYEIISGHRRLRASVKVGLETVPALIYAVTRDEAAIMLVDSNLLKQPLTAKKQLWSNVRTLRTLFHQKKTPIEVNPKKFTEIKKAASRKGIIFSCFLICQNCKK